MLRGMGFGGGTRYVGNTGRCVVVVVVDVRQTIGKASGEAVDEVDVVVVVEMDVVVLLFVDVTSRW